MPLRSPCRHAGRAAAGRLARPETAMEGEVGVVASSLMSMPWRAATKPAAQNTAAPTPQGMPIAIELVGAVAFIDFVVHHRRACPGHMRIHIGAVPAADAGVRDKLGHGEDGVSTDSSPGGAVAPASLSPPATRRRMLRLAPDDSGRETVAAKNKVIITCAVTGAIHTPSMSPYLPITAGGDRRRCPRRGRGRRRDRPSACAQPGRRPPRPDARGVRCRS